jgi:hypothetical protein
MVDLVVQEMWKSGGPYDPNLGRWFVMAPENQEMILDYTTPMGGCSKFYWSFVFWLPKLDYKVKKVDESMNVSPVHAEIYNLFIGQKEKIEGQIKSGLASAAQSVADYELIEHDYRRYNEIWEYFKEGKKDSHVLRSLFVDRVDAYTGEGFSLITMAKRWPTIITDFIRMGNPKYKEMDWKKIDDIKNALDVPAAEATVLKTKNELFDKWRTLFLPAVKDRLVRIEALRKARKRSVEEYRKWLKPYVARHKMMKDALEGKPSEAFSSAYMLPAFGQASLGSTARLWVWKPFVRPEPHKAESVRYNKRPEPDPYDDLVKEWKKKIENIYNVEISKEEVDDIIENDLKFPDITSGRGAQMIDMYYIFFDIKLTKTVTKTPDGAETENMMFYPIKTFIFSQNALLINMIEVRAREKQFEKEVNELIGVMDEESMMKDLEDEMAGKKKLKKGEVSGRLNRAGSRIKRALRPFSKYIVRGGPYESNMKERVTKMYMVTSGGLYGEIVDFFKERMGVGKASVEVYE